MFSFTFLVFASAHSGNLDLGGDYCGDATFCQDGFRCARDRSGYRCVANPGTRISPTGGFCGGIPQRASFYACLLPQLCDYREGPYGTCVPKKRPTGLLPGNTRPVSGSRSDRQAWEEARTHLVTKPSSQTDFEFGGAPPANGPVAPGRGPPVGSGASILYGKTNADFTSLDSRHPYAWVVGPLGVKEMLSMGPREQLDFVGWPLDFVDSALCAGNEFKIFNFNFEDLPFATRADWDGLVYAMREGSSATAASKKCADKVAPHLDVLKTMPWKAFIKKFGDPRQLSASEANSKYHGFENFANAKESDVFAARAFLFYTLDADELYMGNGWTYDAKGNKGGDEYLVTPMKLTNVKGGKLTSMDGLHCPHGQAPLKPKRG